MKTAVYFCNCGTSITERIDPAEVTKVLSETPDVVEVTSVDYLRISPNAWWWPPARPGNTRTPSGSASAMSE